MSRTKKHRDIFFLKFLSGLIKLIGNPHTDYRAFRWSKVRRRVSGLYGGTNKGDNQRLESKYNRTPYKRNKKRAERQIILNEVYGELEDNYEN